MIKAKELADNDILNALNSWFQMKPENKNEKVDAVTEIYNALNLKEITQEKILRLTQKALDLLDQVNVENDKKIELKNLAGKLINRNF